MKILDYIHERSVWWFCHNANLYPKVLSKMVHETRKISSGGNVDSEQEGY